MHVFRSLFLLCLVGLLGACGTLGKSPPSAPSSPVAATPDLAPLLKRLTALEDAERRRGQAEREARGIATTTVANPSFGGISNCFEIPKALASSEYYEEFTRVMDAQYAVSCLFGAKKVEDERRRQSKSSPPPPKKK